MKVWCLRSVGCIAVSLLWLKFPKLEGMVGIYLGQKTLERYKRRYS
jgi:hypothetical protein